MSHIRNPHSPNLSEHQRIVLRRAIVGGRYATVPFMERMRWPNLDRTLKVMVERNLILIINEEQIVPTPRGRAVYQLAKEKAEQWKYRRGR